MSLRELYETSPLGVFSAFNYGLVQAALFTMLAVYAASMNFSIFEISIVTFLLSISGAISQWPIGKLSDMFDRRLVLIYSTFAAAFFGICAIFSAGQMYLPDGLATSKFWFYIFVILFAVVSLPMFAIILAYTNDYIPKEKFVVAGAGLQTAFGLGAMSGPFLCSMLMSFVGPNGFWMFLIFFHAVIGLFGVYRMRIRKRVEENPDSSFTPMPESITPVGMELNPQTEPIEEPAPMQATTEENTQIIEPTDTIEVIDPVEQTQTIKEPTDENRN
jgi:MFS family permease